MQAGGAAEGTGSSSTRRAGSTRRATSWRSSQKIRRVVAKIDPTAPHHSWLVVDGSLGANSIEQARAFHKSFGLTGLIVTKLDGTSKGGALVGIWRELRLPIVFVGLGEKPEDLQEFRAADYADAVFGVGAA